VEHKHPSSAPSDVEGSPLLSPNFDFLAKHDPLLIRYAAQAERFVFEDASLALIRLRQFAELLGRQAAANVGIKTTDEDDFLAVLNWLRERRAVTADILDLFHGLRKAGNAAVHSHTGTRSEALHQLRMARTLGVWFHRSFGKDKKFKPGPFLPPPDPAQASRELTEELERLRQKVVDHRQEAEKASLNAAQEAELRRKAEAEARRAYDELAAALALAEESEAQLTAERARFQEQLAALQASVAAEPAETVEAVVEQAQQAATLLDLDEAATRRIIDQQLRDAGWEADTETLSYKNGVRPQKGRNIAIAE
jgi:type I restriction enzyme R subunit